MPAGLVFVPIAHEMRAGDGAVWSVEDEHHTVGSSRRGEDGADPTRSMECGVVFCADCWVDVGARIGADGAV